MEHKKINGLHYHSKILSKDFQKELLNFLENTKDWFSVMKNNPKSRQVLHYGYSYNYRAKNIHEKAPDMPEIILKLREKIRELDHTEFNQCIVNRYLPGQGISKHTDHYKYGPVICCFTIGSGGTMTFSLEDKKEDVYTEKGSLYIMQGDAREKWKHEMSTQKMDYYDGKLRKRGIRYSLTFRMV